MASARVTRARSRTAFVDEDMETPLMKAAWAGNVETIELLLAEGAEIEAQNWEGKTPLMAAAIYGHADALEALIRAGAALDAKCESGYTAGYYAYMAGNHKIVQDLQEAGERKAETGGIQLIEPPLIDAKCKNCGGGFFYYADGSEVTFSDGRDALTETYLCMKCGNKAKFRGTGTGSGLKWSPIFGPR